MAREGKGRKREEKWKQMLFYYKQKFIFKLIYYIAANDFVMA